jgi:hypothetical protein
MASARSSFHVPIWWSNTAPSGATADRTSQNLIPVCLPADGDSLSAGNARALHQQMPGNDSDNIRTVWDFGRGTDFLHPKIMHTATIGTAAGPIDRHDKRPKNPIDALAREVQPFLRRMGNADVLDEHTQRPSLNHSACRSHQMHHPMQTAPAPFDNDARRVLPHCTHLAGVVPVQTKTPKIQHGIPTTSFPKLDEDALPRVQSVSMPSTRRYFGA